MWVHQGAEVHEVVAGNVRSERWVSGHEVEEVVESLLVGNFEGLEVGGLEEASLYDIGVAGIAESQGDLHNCPDKHCSPSVRSHLSHRYLVKLFSEMALNNVVNEVL